MWQRYTTKQIFYNNNNNKPTGTPDRTRTCNLRLSLPLQFSLPCPFPTTRISSLNTVFTPKLTDLNREIDLVCGLDYIFTISGGARIVSTDPAETTLKLYTPDSLPPF